MNPVAPLWAVDVGDLLGIAVVIVVMLLSVLWQWLVKAAQLERRMQPPGRPAPPPQPPPDQSVQDEIGEFLRRAAQRRGAPADVGPPRRAAPEQPAEKPVAAEIVPETAVGNEVIEHVQTYLNTGEFTRRSSELGSEVAQADSQFGEHLRQVFGHDVGKLAGKPGESAAAPAADESVLPAADQLTSVSPLAAADVAALLADIDGIRQAIVLNEVLRRPEERWA